MKETVQAGALPQYLRNLGQATLLAVSITMAAGDVTTNITSGYRLAEAAEQHPDFFGDGPYAVEYTTQQQDEDQPDIAKTEYVYAFTLKAWLAGSGTQIGGLDSLIAALAGFEYILKLEVKEAFSQGTVLIALPTSPTEIAELEKILAENAQSYFFPDGTGTFNLNNLRFGKGVFKS